MVRLPHLVLASFRCDLRTVHRSQVERFLLEVSQLARERWEGLSGQLLDDALRASASECRALLELEAPAVVTATRQALTISRRALDEAAFAEYVAALARLHAALRDATPAGARLAAWLGGTERWGVSDQVLRLLDEASAIGAQE